MQQVTISGRLLSDAEICTDRNNNKYVRFDVTCGDSDMNGRTIYTHYHCTCYMSGFDSLKKGDQVFLTGRLNAKISQSKDGKPYLNLNVMVYQASGGYIIQERKPLKA